MATKPPKKKRIRNPVETRAKLLQATIDLVSEKGAAALSMKEAARRANVSRGVAYLHFADRDQLLHEAKNWISGQLQQGVMHFDREASFHDITVYTTKLVLEHPDATRLMINAAMAGKGLDRKHPLYKLVVKMLKELMESGKARPNMDAEILAYIMFGSTAATIMLGAQNKKANIDDLAERFTNEWGRILRGGIFANPGKPESGGSRAARKTRASAKSPGRRKTIN